jgi:hypothetical protein
MQEAIYTLDRTHTSKSVTTPKGTVKQEGWCIVKQVVARTIDVGAAPFTFLSSMLLKLIRKLDWSVTQMRLSKRIFEAVGVFPILDYYYEPMFNPSSLTKSLREDRQLPGIDLDVQQQLNILKRFDFNDELKRFPIDKLEEGTFYYHNDFFESGDAEYLYNMIRLYKPSRLVEIGGGFSTLIAQEAIKKNSDIEPSYSCEHICIEPYENEWLDSLGLIVVREPVQNVRAALFRSLEENDILFVDSSHVIRPQGDVLFEYLDVFPLLGPGVLVHMHDIFTPKDYPDEWVLDTVRLWNEQYLLEAFLTFNNRFRVIGALNFLAHNYPAHLAAKCPIFALESSHREPGSFWMLRVESSD